ncbi:MAG: UDP-N-acetylmuramoyl-tripeptide--D-alanyl-D-alanine ligase [Parcubacteria group bacterium Gr01-1014_18]|nr:MAG: UDP-N-acetylmuramoyl-tripeptide--D-alanyl-D-alanine ligase [Parcubacteria group bacterium Greene0416_36]TSC81414.1 MAG: UDP-N-acetylmuramoyl-tripeptide--D-alanyl-D-alanine ligase [Parcubacteria group bacterium Gr01-1014_18]TSC99012.1 MAG: UDP-N-acetylmuramoyl-tripeptide--D-alanyl-D-alanine ligase [Parcubacteria group bacterium Greene1014_20]TSD07307.1 MAG: UDP-N-acetylmuramoyl-tripeptide--D-alanyl-D-alanine ligase [Parcubacteria group bacterium Greene0714_2]
MKTHLMSKRWNSELFFWGACKGVLLLAGLYVSDISTLSAVYGPADVSMVVFCIAVMTLYSFEFFNFIRSVLKHRFYRPRWTVKSSFLAGSSMVFLFLLMSLTIFAAGMTGFIEMVVYSSVLLSALEYDLLLPLFISFLILLLYPFSYLGKKLIVYLAKRKICGFPNLKIIGITGSYGKSSTKEFLAVILGTKYKVLKTAGNTNTEIGVAQTILKQLKPEHEVFVVEMGAYRKGEIQDICDLVAPQIGILTAISNQHLALFGSQQNIIDAKFELVEDVLSRGGTAVVNGENEFIQEYLSTHFCKGTKFCALTEIRDDIIVYNKKNEDAVLSGNLQAAIEVARLLGLSENEIQKGLLLIRPSERAMVNKSGWNSSTIIDNTYNANTVGCLSALDSLKKYSGKKFFVFSEIQELGADSEKDHNKIGEYAATRADMIFICNKNYSDSIIKGALRGGMNEKQMIVETDYKKLAQQLKEIVQKDDVVLLYGRGPNHLGY